VGFPSITENANDQASHRSLSLNRLSALALTAPITVDTEGSDKTHGYSDGTSWREEHILGPPFFLQPYILSGTLYPCHCFPHPNLDSLLVD
jgi:hypothetical protein